MVLPTALNMPLDAMFANWGRRKGFALAPRGGDDLSRRALGEKYDQ